MTEPERIAKELRATYDGSPWHGPNLRDLLADIDAERALNRAIPRAHTIWELVLHLTAWEQAALSALAGHSMPQMPWSGDWVAVKVSNSAAWREAQQQLKRTHEQLVAAAEQFPEDRLDAIVPGRTYSFHWLLHGMAQHAAYHAGQIAVLKKGVAYPTD